MRKGVGGDCSGRMEGLAQRAEGRNSEGRDRRTGANYAMPQCTVLKKAGFYSECSGR